jgi:CrcB protein
VTETLSALFWVAFGGAIGGPLRFFFSGLVGRRFGETFPWGTLAVNVSGAVAIGVLWAVQRVLPPYGWTFFATGVLGSYTTVSSFSLQTLALARDGQARAAALHAAGATAACLAGAALGAWIGRLLS